MVESTGRLEALHTLIGSTPLLGIDCEFRGRSHRIWAKLETLNLTGSVKDRMAYHVLADAYAREAISSGDRIVEATSGNTGISFAAIGKALGHPVRIHMPDWMSRERKQLIAAFGAEILPVTAEEGGFVEAVARAHGEEAPGTFLPCQFENPANPDAHEQATGPEILAQLAIRDLVPEAFVAGVGTGGTVMGVARAFRAAGVRAAIHPLEPASSPTLRTGVHHGSHRIQGISDEFVPDVLDLDDLDEIIDVEDGDAIIMAQRLSAELGLGVGISSGANLLGALRVADELDRSVVATIFPDSSKKYLSTDLARPEPVRDDYLAPQITLTGFVSIPCPGAAAS